MDELESRIAELEEKIIKLKKAKGRRIKVTYILQGIYTLIIMVLFIFSDIDHSEISNLVQITQQLMLFPDR